MNKLLFVTTVMVCGGAAAQGLPDHSTFARVLSAHHQEELFDYGGLKQSSAVFDAYLGELNATPMANVASADPKARLAFWINAYNACAIRLVLEHYPIDKRGGIAGLVNAVKGYPANSIQQIPDTWKRPFCQVAGATRSLDDIEHGIIRPMGDPRIHFAVNCASRSCPVLAATPYTAEHLDRQLDAAVRRFVASPRQYELRRSEPPELFLNKVLDWYKDDFGGESGVVEFLLPYLTEADAQYLRAHGPPRISFMDYDWTLNDTADFGTRSPS